MTQKLLAPDGPPHPLQSFRDFHDIASKADPMSVRQVLCAKKSMLKKTEWFLQSLPESDKDELAEMEAYLQKTPVLAASTAATDSDAEEQITKSLALLKRVGSSRS